MTAYAETLENDRRLLWGLCYRMTGNAADADDLVQDTLVRALRSERLFIGGDLRS